MFIRHIILEVYAQISHPWHPEQLLVIDLVFMYKYKFFLLKNNVTAFFYV